jgi:hypothetical protein
MLKLGSVVYSMNMEDLILTPVFSYLGAMAEVNVNRSKVNKKNFIKVHISFNRILHLRVFTLFHVIFFSLKNH